MHKQIIKRILVALFFGTVFVMAVSSILVSLALPAAAAVHDEPQHKRALNDKNTDKSISAQFSNVRYDFSSVRIQTNYPNLSYHRPYPPESSHANERLLINDADANGTIMDFMIAGFPKCGTTTMSANLGRIAPMPAGDICTPVSQHVWYAYHNWPNRRSSDYIPGGEHRYWRGVKCPRLTEEKGGLEG
uniref:Sulfotransferase domain-containing protein n=1 Tax=Odontella aurita TaxID=265563 RepID=A0A7S4N7M9_9STRA